MLEEVARLHTLVVQVPVYLSLAQAIQELSKAVNKFQNYFNDKASQMLIQLDMTKRHMAAAQICSCVHVALVNLACNRELHSQFY
jgi:hypothetical protein